MSFTYEQCLGSVLLPSIPSCCHGVVFVLIQKDYHQIFFCSTLLLVVKPSRSYNNTEHYDLFSYLYDTGQTISSNNHINYSDIAGYTYTRMFILFSVSSLCVSVTQETSISHDLSSSSTNIISSSLDHL